MSEMQISFFVSTLSFFAGRCLFVALFYLCCSQPFFHRQSLFNHVRSFRIEVVAFSQLLFLVENVLVDPPQPDTDAKNKPETRDDRLRSDPPCGSKSIRFRRRWALDNLVFFLIEDEIPLFNNHCVSRSAYTGIFLTSIILAGLSFLMLIVSTVIKALSSWICLVSFPRLW